jgi:hypothetical protein
LATFSNVSLILNAYRVITASIDFAYKNIYLYTIVRDITFQWG